MPVRVFTIETHNNARRKFASECGRWGLLAFPVGFLDTVEEAYGGLTEAEMIVHLWRCRPYIFDVVGPLDLQEELAKHWTVNNVSLVLIARIGRGSAQGSGDEGGNAKREQRFRKLASDEKRAILADERQTHDRQMEAQRRAHMTPFEREFEDVQSGQWESKQDEIRRRKLSAAITPMQMLSGIMAESTAAPFWWEEHGEPCTDLDAMYARNRLTALAPLPTQYIGCFDLPEYAADLLEWD